jgi:hypothetical protein
MLFLIMLSIDSMSHFSAAPGRLDNVEIVYIKGHRNETTERQMMKKTGEWGQVEAISGSWSACC